MGQISVATEFVKAAIDAWDASSVPDDLKDLATPTPAEVIIRTEARPPVTDPTFNIQVPAPSGKAVHRLVAIGDSLTHGFQSDAIFNTDWSYPAMIARELGWYDSFRHPEYRGLGGLPLNIEYLVRELEQRYGSSISFLELAPAVFTVYNVLTQIRDYWEYGPGAQVPNTLGIMHNLGISGYDVRDVLSRTADYELQSMQVPTDPLLNPMVANAGQLMARYVLNSAVDNTKPVEDAAHWLTPVQAAAALGQEGIETLIIFIGANNALRTVIDLGTPRWSKDPGYADLNTKGQYNIWNPLHFAHEYDELASAIWDIGAQHVIYATVPHVTIAPVARGVGLKVARTSRYFPFYTRPWITDDRFDASSDPYITANQARAIDSAIDQYNDCIAEVVKFARQNQKDWLLLDVAGLLDRVAARRYILDPAARPSWWTPYALPEPLRALTPVPDSQFFSADTSGRLKGGLFSLDGVHATTITYAILAQEFINVMVKAGIVFYQSDGTTPRTGPITIDFNSMIRRDTLINDPPQSLASDLQWAGWLDELLDWVKRLARVL